MHIRADREIALAGVAQCGLALQALRFEAPLTYEDLMYTSWSVLGAI